jgi:hypothetical protein
VTEDVDADRRERLVVGRVPDRDAHLEAERGDRRQRIHRQRVADIHGFVVGGCDRRDGDEEHPEK